MMGLYYAMQKRNEIEAMVKFDARIKDIEPVPASHLTNIMAMGLLGFAVGAVFGYCAGREDGYAEGYAVGVTEPIWKKG